MVRRVHGSSMGPRIVAEGKSAGHRLSPLRGVDDTACALRHAVTAVGGVFLPGTGGDVRRKKSGLGPSRVKPVRVEAGGLFQTDKGSHGVCNKFARCGQCQFYVPTAVPNVVRSASGSPRNVIVSVMIGATYLERLPGDRHRARELP